MARGNPVKFVFVSSGSNMPNNPNADTIYFLEDEKKLYVGSSLIADHIDPVNVDEYLIDYKLKDAEVLGTGSFLSNATIPIRAYFTPALLSCGGVAPGG